MTGPVTQHSVSTRGGGTPVTTFRGRPFSKDWEKFSRGNTSFHLHVSRPQSMAKGCGGGEEALSRDSCV